MDYNSITKRILTEDDGKGIVFTFGRFSPPHIGHELLINKVKKVAKQHRFEHGIYASKSHDKTRNPLKYKDKIAFMKKAFKNANVVNDPNLINPFFVAKKLSDDGYKHVILVVGGDRVSEMDKNIRAYINHSDPKKSFNFETFKVISAGSRDADSDDVQGMFRSIIDTGIMDKRDFSVADKRRVTRVFGFMRHPALYPLMRETVYDE